LTRTGVSGVSSRFKNDEHVARVVAKIRYDRLLDVQRVATGRSPPYGWKPGHPGRCRGATVRICRPHGTRFRRCHCVSSNRMATTRFISCVRTGAEYGDSRTTRGLMFHPHGHRRRNHGLRSPLTARESRGISHGQRRNRAAAADLDSKLLMKIPELVSPRGPDRVRDTDGSTARRLPPYPLMAAACSC
jgi:hypothetical protein